MPILSRMSALSCLAVTLSALGGVEARAATLYGAAYDGPDGLATLYRIDPATGGAVGIGPIGFQRVGGIDFGADGRLYGVAERNDGTNSVVLIGIDVATGAGTEIGPTGLPAGTAVTDISFRPSDGRIHAYLGAPDRTATFDTATGLAALVGASGLTGRGNGLAFTLGNRLLLAGTDTAAPVSTLYRLNQTTGVATTVVAMTYGGFPPVVDALRIGAMEVEPLTGQTIAAVQNGTGGAPTTYLASVNLVTGAVLYVGNTTAGLEALAWQPDHCEVTLYGAAYSGPDGLATLYRLDATTGATTTIGPIGFQRVSGIDFGPDGRLYGVGERNDGSDASVLIEIDPATGAGVEVGPTGILDLGSDVINDISFRSDGVLYAYLHLDEQLATIDTTTGAATLVGETGIAGGGNGIGFSGGDFLFLESVPGPFDNLYRVDTTTGAAAVVAATTYAGFPPPGAAYRTNALDLDPTTGVMYGSVIDSVGGSGPAYLATVDTDTGRITKVGRTVSGLDGLAWRAECDDAEPCTSDVCGRCREIELYGAAFSGPNGLATLYRIVPGTGASAAVGPIGFERVSAMDFDERSGLIYATGERADGSNVHVLIVIDPATGAGTEIGPTGVAATGFGETVTDVSFRGSDGRLYAYIDDSDGLGVIDRTTGALTALGPSGVGCCGNGIEFSRADILFHANDNAVHTVDQTTGEATPIAALSFQGFPPPTEFYRVVAMDVDCGGTLYAAVKDTGGPAFLATLDAGTGLVTNIGPTGVNLDAVTFRTARGVCRSTFVDSDGDAVCDGLDCAPHDPETFAVPSELSLTSVVKAGPTSAAYAFSTPDGGVVALRDTVGGDVRFLPAGPGGGDEFALCNHNVNPVFLNGNPGPGQAVWILERGRNACGAGTYGFERRNLLPPFPLLTERSTTTCP